MYLPVHCILIRDMGMTLGEILDFEELAGDCAADGVWEFFFCEGDRRRRYADKPAGHQVK